MSMNSPNLTIENLRLALSANSKAAVQLCGYASRAAQEQHPCVEKLFSACSLAHRILAGNHAKALQEFGEELPLVNFSIDIQSSQSNLHDSLSTSSSEIADIYPNMIHQAELDEQAHAARSFNWSLIIERQHIAYYSQAIEHLEQGSDCHLPRQYAICPICGDTLSAELEHESCPLCGCSSNLYIYI